MLQIELHPYLNQKQLVRMAKENGIAVTGFSNLASASYVEIGGAKAEESPQNLPEIIEIATKHSKTPA